MKPEKEGWPLWVWLRGVGSNNKNYSKIEHLLGGKTANLNGRNADRLVEFVQRVVRRYPNTILAADSNSLYSLLVRRYRTNWATIQNMLPSPSNSIGYLVATKSDIYPVSATAWANVEIRYMDEKACKRILNAARNREQELSKKKNSMLSGEARDAAILLAELSGGLRK
jgi:hypothetical protein